jgi:type IV secretion system protein VirB9
VGGSIGDRARWKLFVITAKYDKQQMLVLLTPTKPDVSTKLILNTDRRTYFLELHATKDAPPAAAVEWTYPKEHGRHRSPEPFQHDA